MRCPVCGCHETDPFDGEFVVCRQCAEILAPSDLVRIRIPFITTHRYYASGRGEKERY